jgi:hypothetical protein
VLRRVHRPAQEPRRQRSPVRPAHRQLHRQAHQRRPWHPPSAAHPPSPRRCRPSRRLPQP